MSLPTLREVELAAELHGCEVVTKEFLEGVSEQSARLHAAQEELRATAALRLVAQRRDWRGRLTRRWIRRTEEILRLLGREA